MMSELDKTSLRGKITWVLMDPISNETLEKLTAFPIKHRKDALSLDISALSNISSEDIDFDSSLMKTIEDVNHIISTDCEVKKRSLYLGGDASLGQTGFYVPVGALAFLCKLEIDLSVEVFDL